MKETKIVECPVCEGTGKRVVEDNNDWNRQVGSVEDCPDCHGSGEVKECKACGFPVEGCTCQNKEEKNDGS